MKTWQLRGATATSTNDAPTAAPASAASGAAAEATTTDPSRRARALDVLFSATQRFWRRVGAARPRVCQFVVDGDAAKSWYLAVDADGGRARTGRHPAPDVVWESDAEALDALFSGRVLPGRVRVRGDFELVRETFVALAQAV